MIAVFWLLNSFPSLVFSPSFFFWYRTLSASNLRIFWHDWGSRTTSSTIGIDKVFLSNCDINFTPTSFFHIAYRFYLGGVRLWEAMSMAQLCGGEEGPEAGTSGEISHNHWPIRQWDRRRQWKRNKKVSRIFYSRIFNSEVKESLPQVVT